MSYKKLDYTESGIPANASYLEHLERGIIANEEAVKKVRIDLAEAQLEGAQIDTSNFVKQDEILDFTTLKEVAAQGYLKESQLEPYAKKTDLSGFMSESDLEIKLATTDFVTESELAGKGYLTQHQSLTNYYTKTETANLYLTKTDAANKYQLKGTATGGIAQTSPVDGQYSIRTINHRGYNTVAPENTIPAYILSKAHDYTMVECDVSFTSDNVPVLIHNANIYNATGTSLAVSSLTYEELLEYEFRYGKTEFLPDISIKIPTLAEFLTYCKNLSLYPYIEIKNTHGDNTNVTAQMQKIVDTVKACGLQGKVTYISFQHDWLSKIKDIDPTARLGFLPWNSDFNIDTAISNANKLKTGSNEVFLDIDYGYIYNDTTNAVVNACMKAGIPLEVWTISSNAAVVNPASPKTQITNLDGTALIQGLHPYISGVTTDDLHAGKILAEYYNVYRDVEDLPIITLPETETEEPDPEEPDTPVVPDPEPDPEEPEEPVYYNISRNLTNVTTNDEALVDTIKAGNSYIVILDALENHMLSTVSVTMGGVDITESAYVYNSDGYTGGRINIASVTGDINITAEAINEIVVVNFENCSCSHKKEATDDGSYFGMGYRALANKNRVSYPRFDLRLPDFDDNTSAVYTIELDVANEDCNYTHNAALQFYSNYSLGLVEKGSQYNDTLDTGWLTAIGTTQDSTTNIKTYTFTYSPATHNPSTSGNVMSYATHRAGKRSNGNNSPIAGVKLAIRRTDNSNWNSTTYTNIKEVRITRTDA